MLTDNVHEHWHPNTNTNEHIHKDGYLDIQVCTGGTFPYTESSFAVALIYNWWWIANEQTPFPHLQVSTAPEKPMHTKVAPGFLEHVS